MINYLDFNDNEQFLIYIQENMHELTEEVIESFLIANLGICGCGIPIETGEMIYSILRSIKEETYETKWDVLSKYSIVKDSPVHHFILYILDDKGILAHGSNIIGAWLDLKGEIILKGLELYYGKKTG